MVRAGRYITVNPLAQSRRQCMVRAGCYITVDTRCGQGKRAVLERMDFLYLYLLRDYSIITAAVPSKGGPMFTEGSHPQGQRISRSGLC